jgi:hypothetical protein
MPATDATPFPVNAQAFRCPCVFRDTSGNLITGWTSAAATAYPDNQAGVSLTIAESPVSSGIGYIDIPPAQMTCSMCCVVATISNPNWTAFAAAIYPMNLQQFNGRYDAQSPLRYEQMILDLYSALGINGASQTGAAFQALNPDGSIHFAAAVTQNNTSGSRTKMA